MSRDYALGPGPDGQPLLHRSDCPIVRAQADEGEPVMTMMDCQRDHRELDVARCRCLEDG